MSTQEVFHFKQAVPATERRRQADAQMAANPSFVPVVCEAFAGDECPEIPNPLLVLPVSANIGGLTALLKEQLGTKRRLVLRARGKVLLAGNEIGGLYDLYKDAEDHFLYIRYETLEPEPLLAVVEAVVLATLISATALGVLHVMRRRSRT